MWRSLTGYWKLLRLKQSNIIIRIGMTNSQRPYGPTEPPGGTPQGLPIDIMVAAGGIYLHV
jgi:hypothetical protein